MFQSLLKNYQRITPHAKKVILTGKPQLTIPDIVAVARHFAHTSLQPTDTVVKRLKTVQLHMLNQIHEGLAIYGTTTAYGAQANQVFTRGKETTRYQNARALSEAIVHVDVSTGPIIPDDLTRAAMLIRINMLLPGYSGVRLSSLELLRKMLNKRLVPQVGYFGTVGASGDLALNGRVLSALLHRPETKVKLANGTLASAPTALGKAKIHKLILNPKEGLGFVNGDNFSTSAAALIIFDLTHLMFVNTLVMSLTIQALKGSVRNYHPLLETLRPHPGQIFTASMLRALLVDSHLAIQELSGPQKRPMGTIVQDPYSLRCLPQYFGPDWETLAQAWDTITINANSVSDNPLWTTPKTTFNGEEPYQWVSGGNFLAMHMSDTLDKLRKVAIHIVKQNDRHLNRLVNPNLNNGLPPNLSDEEAISKCTFKGLQTQMGMYDIFASSLAIPISTAFGIHEELNQDFTSHAMTSAWLTEQVMQITKYAIATNLISACQAIDQRGTDRLLSPTTKPLYHWLREHVPYIKQEQPLGHYVELVAKEIMTPDFHQLISPLINYDQPA